MAKIRNKMTAYTWKTNVTSGDWETASNWNHSGGGTATYPHLSGDTATIATATGRFGNNVVVTIGSGETISIANVTITGNTGHSRAATLQMSGGSLTTSGAVTLSNSDSAISGYGTIDATTGFVRSGGTPTIQASGGVLDLTGNITTSIALSINSGSASTLKLESTVSQSSIAINNANQTLEIGSSGSLTLTSAESITNGAIKLDGGALTDSSGFTIGTGATLTGTGTVSGAITGSGTITANGGALTLSGQVDASGTASSLVIDDGSTLQLTSTAALGAAGINPTLTFIGNGDLFIDTAAAVGTLHLGAISGFSGTDKIQIKAIGSGDTVSWDGVNKLTISNGLTSQTFTFAAGTAGQYITVSDVSGVDTLTICFMAGTMIRTPDGEVAVEALKPGDLVLTTTGEAKPVNWVGRQTVSKRFADPLRSYPIRVRAGALDDNTPVRDLLISPDHALLVGGVMVQAGALVNGTSITRERTIPDTFVYYHVELDDHSLIFAEGAPAETFVDNVDRMNFDNWSEYQALYPNGKTVEELPYPRAKSHRQVPVPLRVALAERALGLGAGDAAEVA
jgi:hypothetical protein